MRDIFPMCIGKTSRRGKQKDSNKVKECINPNGKTLKNRQILKKNLNSLCSSRWFEKHSYLIHVMAALHMPWRCSWFLRWELRWHYSNRFPWDSEYCCRGVVASVPQCSGRKGFLNRGYCLNVLPFHPEISPSRHHNFVYETNFKV